jgi:hypothetical protein
MKSVYSAVRSSLRFVYKGLIKNWYYKKADKNITFFNSCFFDLPSNLAVTCNTVFTPSVRFRNVIYIFYLVIETSVLNTRGWSVRSKYGALKIIIKGHVWRKYAWLPDRVYIHSALAKVKLKITFIGNTTHKNCVLNRISFKIVINITSSV